MTIPAQMARVDEFITLLDRLLPEETKRHSISVAEFLIPLAGPLGFDTERGVWAGLLHDMRKATPPDELLDLTRRYGLEVPQTWREKPKLLHGPVAAEECRRTLHIEDPGLHEAVYWHTTGRPGLGALGRALYLADFAEPLRTHPEAGEARALLAEQGFDAALRFAVSEKLRHVLTRPPVDSNTAAFHAWIHDGFQSSQGQG